MNTNFNKTFFATVLAVGFSSGAFADASSNQASGPAVGFASHYGADVNSAPNPQSVAYLLQQKNKVPYESAVFGVQAEFDQQKWDGDAEYQGENGDVNNYGSGSYVSLVRFNTLVNFNKWVSAYFRVQAAGEALKPSVTNAFVTVGNLDYSPFYVSVGQNYLPVGAFSADAGPYSNGVNTTDFLVGSSYQQVDFGYYKNGFNAQFAVFKSDDPTQPKNKKSSSLNDFATSVYYQAQANNFFSYTVGAGYVKDFRFTNSSWAEDATGNHAVPVANENGSVTFNKVYTVSAEYNQATSASKYTEDKGSDHNHNRKPSAWTVGSSYAPTVFGKQTTFWASYSQTKDMKGFASPEGGYCGQYADPNGFKSSYNFAVTRPVFFDKFFVSFDYQRAHDYAGKTANVFTLDENVEF